MVALLVLRLSGVVDPWADALVTDSGGAGGGARAPDRTRSTAWRADLAASSR